MQKFNNDIFNNIQPWQPLTEIPQPVQRVINEKSEDKSVQSQQIIMPAIGPELKKILLDLAPYPYSSISTRIKRLNMSGSAFEKGKLEGLEKGLFIESANGQTNYLILTEKGYEFLDMPCPYYRNVSTEHSFRVNMLCFLLKIDPAVRSVHPELKLGDSGHTSDAVSVNHNGSRTAWEITLSTSNILSNASKYERTDFVKIIFLCRDFKLKEAVRASFRESGLNPDLLARIDYMHFSQLLGRQRKLYQY